MTAAFPGAARVEQVMGMPVGIDIRTALPAREVHGLLTECFAWLRWVDATFTTYDPDSEISRLARGADLRPSPEVAEVLARCAELRARTGGYFSAHATGRLDPSGYVKGWAVERLSRALSAAGAVDHCVNAGGDVRVRGSKHPGVPWRVGVRHPLRDTVCKVIVGHDLAVATSGAYERGAHVVNPHTGKPARGLSSVTVTGPDLGVCDAYATAVFAAGKLTFHPGPAYDLLLIDDRGRALSTPGLTAA